MKKVLTLLGDYYHNHDKFWEVVKYVFQEQEINLIDSSIDNFHHFLNENSDLVILGRENRINPQEKDTKIWMSENVEKDLVNYVESGGKLLVWHSGLASYDIDGLYINMIKGYFKYHPEQKLVTYYGEDIEFSFVDEHYFVYCDEKNTKVFLRSNSEDGESIAGWIHDFGKGKILCITPAHDIGLKDEKFRNYFKGLINSLL